MTVHELVEGVLAADRAAVGRALTLVESTRSDHRVQARELLDILLLHAVESHRIGIPGVPGVGKRTFIKSLGNKLTGGSILGDKTRMLRLANDPAAFVRPSPSTGTLGGVSRTTRETMVILEAAGYDVVLVETVGVGQSETMVAGMVDFFLLLMLPGAGDELQGIKKGVLELADMIAINKADGDNAPAARTAARDYSAALRLTEATSPTWTPSVVTCAGLTGDGLDELWDQVMTHRSTLTATGEWENRRRDQRLAWMWSMVEDRLITALRTNPGVLDLLGSVEADVRDGRTSPAVAADRLLDAFGG